MIAWVRKMFSKYKEIILYLVFGVLTTAVNWLVFYPLYNFADWSATLSKALAWVVAVLFAFVTNKPFVFESRDWSINVLLPELIKFVGCRVASGLLEIGFIYLTVEILLLDGNIMNIVVSVFVVLINYIGSKLLFKNKD